MHLLSILRRKRIQLKLLKEVKNSSQKIKFTRELTSEQEKEIKQYWRNLLDIDIPLDWHRYFYKRTGVYSVKYIPTSLYYLDIIGRVNQMKLDRAYNDKNLTEQLLKGVKHPETIVSSACSYLAASWALAVI